MARRTYQRGRLGDLREVVDAGEPQDVLERASMLRSVFAHQDASLDRLTAARLALGAAGRRAWPPSAGPSRGPARAPRSASSAPGPVAAQAEDAAARVAVAARDPRRPRCASAEGARAADQADYAQAQAASRALAERIREAARRAAEQARRRPRPRRLPAQAASGPPRRPRRSAAAAAQPPRRPAPRRAAAAPPGAPPAARRAAAAPGRRRAPAAPAGSGRAAAARRPARSAGATHPIFGDRRLHAGIDMGAPIGTTVRAADGGTVLLAGSASGYGTLVVVSHGGGAEHRVRPHERDLRPRRAAVGRGREGRRGRQRGQLDRARTCTSRSAATASPSTRSAYVGGVSSALDSTA